MILNSPWGDSHPFTHIYLATILGDATPSPTSPYPNSHLGQVVAV